MYNETTNNIKVVVEPIFNNRLSLEEEDKYVWDYSILIENLSEKSITVLERAWVITDADGNVTNICGEGIIGMKPIIKSGSCFTYTSYTVIKTRSGFMEGNYLVESETGEKFEVSVPLFSLDVPFEEKILN